MKKLRLAALWGSLLVLCSLTPTAYAQQSHVYGFVGPGSTNDGGDAIVQIGAGAEGLLGKGFGIGLEGGVLGTTNYFSDSTLGFVSPGVYYHFRRNAKLDPFVTGGYSVFFRNGALNLAHFGGGANYWIRRHFGLKFEVRDHVTTENGPSHFVVFRFGVAF